MYHLRSTQAVVGWASDIRTQLASFLDNVFVGKFCPTDWRVLIFFFWGGGNVFRSKWQNPVGRFFLRFSLQEREYWQGRERAIYNFYYLFSCTEVSYTYGKWTFLMGLHTSTMRKIHKHKKNRKISFFTWQNFVSELFDYWWNPRSTISLPTSFHTFFALVLPLKFCSKYCKSCVFRILHLRLIPLVNKKGNFTKIIIGKERTNDFYLRVAIFLFRT